MCARSLRMRLGRINENCATGTSRMRLRQHSIHVLNGFRLVLRWEVVSDSWRGAVPREPLWVEAFLEHFLVAGALVPEF